MNQGVIAALMGALLRLLTPEVVKIGIDKFLDVVEDAVAKSGNKIDDAIILPLIGNIRTALNIPDNDIQVTIKTAEVNIITDKEPK